MIYKFHTMINTENICCNVLRVKWLNNLKTWARGHTAMKLNWFEGMMIQLKLNK